MLKQTYETLSSIPKGKREKWESQRVRVWRALYYRDMTRLEVASRENIPIQSVCRLVGSLRAEGKIRVVRHGKCPISGMPNVEFLSTRPAPGPGQQINLFG